MAHQKWTPETAVKHILRNCQIDNKKTTPTTIYVLNGSAGLSSLGAIDYLNNHHTGPMRVKII